MTKKTSNQPDSFVAFVNFVRRLTIKKVKSTIKARTGTIKGKATFLKKRKRIVQVS